MSPCHWLSVLSTSGCGQSLSSWPGSSCGGGSQDLISLALIRMGIRWPGGDFRSGSSSGGGTPLGAFSRDRPWCIHRPCCGRDGSIEWLDILSFGQEESHIWGQCRFTTQLIIYVKPTHLFSFFSTRVGALLCCILLLDSQVLDCNFKSLIWRQSHSPVGLDLGGLGEGNCNCLQHSSEGLWCCLDLLLPLNWECHFHDLDCPVGESSLGHLAASLHHGYAEGSWVWGRVAMGAFPTSWGPSQMWCTMQASPSHMFV